MAFMPIQLAADIAPNGARHCIQPRTRPPPPPPPRRERGERRLPHRAEAQHVAAQPARHREHRGDHRRRPGPGRSPPPLIHVGCRRSASSTAVTPPSLMPMPTGAGVGRQPVDVVERQTGVGDRGEARVDRERQRVDHQPPAERRATDARQHGRGARTGRRSSGGRGVGTVGLGDRVVGRRSSPVGSNSGSHTSSCCSKRTATSWPMCTSSGSQPTMFVVSRTSGPPRARRSAIDVRRRRSRAATGAGSP